MPQTERQIRPQGLIQQFTSWFSSLFARGKGVFFTFGTREVLPDIDETEAIELGYKANTAFYSIIAKDAKKFASIPRYVYDAKSMQEKQKKAEKIKLPKQFKEYVRGTTLTNDLSKLLKRPNPYQGQSAFIKTVRSYKTVTENSFVWMNRGETNGLTDEQIELLPVLEMYPLPSNKVRIVPDPENLWGVLGYILEVGGLSLPFKKSEIIHWKGTNLDWDASTRSHLRGMPSLKPGAGSLQQNNESTRSSIRELQNDGAKGAMFKKDGAKLSPQQEADVRSVIDRKINNADLKGAVASLSGDWGYINLASTGADMQKLEVKKFSWQELCFLIGVPYELFNPETTYANKEQAQKGWVSNDIIPDSKEFDDELNRVLLRAFKLEGRAIIACDYSELPEMQADLAAMTTWLALAWWIPPNIKLEMQGFEKGPPEFDEAWIPSGITPLSQSAGDGFDQMMNELQQQGANDYKPTNGKLNGIKT